MEFSRDPKLLRKQILQQRKLISLETRKDAFLKIIYLLHRIPEYQQASSILGYYGKTSSGEFDTSALLEEISRSRKLLYLPRCAADQIQLDLFQIQNFKLDMEMGAYQIMEPIINEKNKGSVADIDVILVPGSVFDREGRRYGYGAGYYDSLLASFSGVKIAFALPFTVMNFPLIVHPQDVPVDIIITPDEIINVANS